MTISLDCELFPSLLMGNKHQVSVGLLYSAYKFSILAYGHYSTIR